MKKLYIIRHAKSSWKDMSLTDDMRPLNSRGKRDAPFMGQKILEIETNVDILISSHAVRAKRTAYEFAKAYGRNKKDVVIEKSLYHASVEDIEGVVYSIDNKLDSAFIFGHNPGFTYFVNMVNGVNIDNVPTCGVVGLEVDVEKWEDFNFSLASLKCFLYPKKYLQFVNLEKP